MSVVWLILMNRNDCTIVRLESAFEYLTCYHRLHSPESSDDQLSDWMQVINAFVCFALSAESNSYSFVERDDEFKPTEIQLSHVETRG